MTDQNTIAEAAPTEAASNQAECGENTFKPDGREAVPSNPKLARRKRDIFRFSGESHSAINLEHVTHIALAGKKITFSFYSTSIFVELADDAAAASVYEVLLNAWASDVLE